ncbi:MAG: DUF5685 family protein [Oscillospiraceae bacterium]|nr:DUF5685 family protein [Oscillospiraceae bacterium]
MFGYIKPLKPELKVKEFELYRSVYCSLCRALSRGYGGQASVILSYDCTFVALLAMHLGKAPPCTKKGRCRVNPLKRCNYCTQAQEQLDFAAALSVLLFYYKIQDTLVDSKLGKLLYLAPYPIAAAMRKKAARTFPELDSIAAEMVKAQQEAEHNPLCCLDEAAEPTAKAIARISQLLGSVDENAFNLHSFGYHIGRWIYLMDAWDDLQKDLKSGNFNPFIKHFELNKGDLQSKLSEINSYANGILNISLSLALEELKKTQQSEYLPILINVVELGLADAQGRLYHKESKF